MPPEQTLALEFFPTCLFNQDQFVDGAIDVSKRTRRTPSHLLSRVRSVLGSRTFATSYDGLSLSSQDYALRQFPAFADWIDGPPRIASA